MLKTQVTIVLLVVGLVVWAIRPLTVEFFVSHPLDWLERVRTNSAKKSTPIASTGKVLLQDISMPKVVDRSPRSRVVAIDPLPTLENTEQVVIISVEIPRSDGSGFDTKKQWIRFISHPLPLEMPELSEPASHL